MGKESTGVVMAIPGTSPVLGEDGAGIVKDGKLAPKARKSFVDDVMTLLKNGNTTGMGLPLSKVLGVPIPPKLGQTMSSPTLADPAKEEPFLWFGPDANAKLSAPYLLDEKSDWNRIFVDGFYASLVSAMNVNGSWTPTLFDPSIYFPDIEIKLEELPMLPAIFAAKVTPQLPKLLLKLKAASLPIVDPPKSPSFSLPAIPKGPSPLPNDFGIGFAFPAFFETFGKSLPKLVVPALPTAVPDMFLKPYTSLIDTYIQTVLDLKLVGVSPKLLTATILVMMHNVAIMIPCAVVGSLLGTGAIVKAVAKFSGMRAD